MTGCLGRDELWSVRLGNHREGSVRAEHYVVVRAVGHTDEEHEPGARVQRAAHERVCVSLAPDRGHVVTRAALRAYGDLHGGEVAVVRHLGGHVDRVVAGLGYHRVRVVAFVDRYPAV